jgi:hypothetical protein
MSTSLLMISSTEERIIKELGNITSRRRAAMLNQQTLDKLYTLKLTGMAGAFADPDQSAGSGCRSVRTTWHHRGRFLPGLGRFRTILLRVHPSKLGTEQEDLRREIDPHQ